MLNYKKSIITLMESKHLQGVVLTIINGQTTFITKGYANASQKLENGATTVVYPLASFQKPLTAAAIYLLIKSQELQFTTTLKKFYPKIQDADRITIAQLLTHSSGLVAPESSPEVSLWESGALNWQLGHLTNQAFPGEHFNYSNLNYVLLAGIIRQITQESYQKFLNEQIFQPAGIKHTFFWNNLPPNYQTAKSYIYEKQNYENENQVKAPLASTLLGAGNLYSTVQDYFLLQQALINGQILTNEDYHDLISQPAKNNLTYRGGMYHESWQGTAYKYIFGYLSSSGAKNQHPNFANEMYLSEDNQNGVILFTNQSPSSLKNHDFKTLAQTIIGTRNVQITRF